MTSKLVSIVLLASLCAAADAPKVEVKGDVRARGEWIYNEDEGKAANERWSQVLRARLGATVSQDFWEVGSRFVTGAGSPVSSNTTMDNAFQSKAVYLDRAYLQLKYNANGFDVKGTVGKMASPFIKPLNNSAELLWGNDLAPEGANLGVVYKAGSMTLSTAVGRFWVDEISAERSSAGALQKDVFLQTEQAALELAPNKGFSVKIGGASHYFNDLKGHVFLGDSTKNANGQSVGARNTYTTHFSIGEGFIDVALNNPNAPLIASFGFSKNIEAEDGNDKAWFVGGKLGKPKVAGQMELGVQYRYAERDATVGYLSSPDYGNGKLNSQGLIANMKYLLTDNLSVDVVGHLMQKYGLKDSDATEEFNRVRLELNATF